MAHTHRTQILMEPEEHARLARLAAQKRVSVADLIRTAIRLHYPYTPQDRAAAVDRIAAMTFPVEPWPEMKRDIEDAYDAGIP